MNLKLFAVLSALALASSASSTSAYQAASTDGSISAEEAAIPLCNQTELVTVANLMTKNNRKKQCEATLGVTELVKATDKKTMCSLTSCTTALKSLYVTLPDCKYLDWAIRYNVKRLLQFCTIDPETISKNLDDYKDIEASNSTNSAGSDKQEATVNWTGSSSGAVSFAPIGGAATPTPVPTAAQQVTPTTTAPASAARSSVAVASSAAAVIAMVASLAL